MANYNDRNGMKEMEERKIDADENMISLKEKTETEKEKEENKDMTKREAEGDYRAWFTNPDWSSLAHRPKKNSNLDAGVLTKAKSKEELDKNKAELLPPSEVLEEQDVIGKHKDKELEKFKNQEEQELAK